MGSVLTLRQQLTRSLLCEKHPCGGKSWGKDHGRNRNEEKDSCYENMGREPKKRGTGVEGGVGGETTGQTQPVCVSTSLHRTDSHEEDRGKSERRRRIEGLREAEMENKQVLTCLRSAINRTSNFPAISFPACDPGSFNSRWKTTAVGKFPGQRS